MEIYNILHYFSQDVYCTDYHCMIFSKKICENYFTVPITRIIALFTRIQTKETPKQMVVIQLEMFVTTVLTFIILIKAISTRMAKVMPAMRILTMMEFLMNVIIAKGYQTVIKEIRITMVLVMCVTTVQENIILNRQILIRMV